MMIFDRAKGCLLATWIASAAATGCAVDGTSAQTDHATDTTTMCGERGLAADCDICAEAGWYDDGICHDFCRQDDVDCFELELSTEPRILGCYENDFSSDLSLTMVDVDERGEWIEQPWPDGTARDLVIGGTSDAGTYLDACVLSASGGEIRCDFGVGEEVRIDLEVRREEICSTMWEDTDVTLFLEGTYDGGVLSWSRPIRCVLETYEHVNPC